MLRIISYTLVALALTACSAPSAGLKIISKTGDPDNDLVLLGSLKLPQKGIRTIVAQLKVSDGELTCEGVSPKSKIDTGWAAVRLQQSISISCSDGRKGKVQIQLSGMSTESMSGVGVGKLDDGSKVRILVGDTVGSLAW